MALGWSADTCVIDLPDDGRAQAVVHTFRPETAPSGPERSGASAGPPGRHAVSGVPVPAWSAASLVLLAAAWPACLWAAARGGAVRRLAGLCMAGTVTGAVLLLLPMAYDRS
ncbi:hypothetical protein VR46_08010, partial [Streptomyces sp. NRRL S-444]